MKPLNFSKNSWHAILWESTFGEGTPPDSICPYFWTTIFAMILFPLCIVGHLINLISRNRSKVVAFPFIFTVPVCFIVYILFATINQAGIWTVLKALCISMIAAILVGFIIAGVVLGLAKLHEYIISKRGPRKEKPYKEPKPSALIEGWNAFMGKYCKPIFWN